MQKEDKLNRGRPAQPITTQEMKMLNFIKSGMQDKDAALKAGLTGHSWVYRRRLEAFGLLEKRDESKINDSSFLMGRMWVDGESFANISRAVGVTRQRVFQVINSLKNKGIIKETKGGKRVFVGE